MKLKESKNLVWSSTAQQDYYGRMSKEELISEIESDFGNFDEFLVWGGFDSIEDVTEDDIREYYLPSDIDLDYEDFTENIMPMVEKQCNDYNETLVLFGSAANWQGSREACAIISADEFKNYIYPDYDADTKIYSDNGALFYTQSSHDTPMGGTALYLYSFKSDDDYEKASHLCDTEDWEGDFADDAGYKEVGEAIKQGFLTPVRNTFNESLEEGWYQFEYKSGANPYIAKTEKERDKILKKYGKKVTKIKDGFYEIDDKEEKMDSFNFDESLEKNLKEALRRYTFTDGMELTASSEEEVIQKYEDIEKNRNKGKTRPFETLNSIAEDLYKKRDDFSFHYFSDDELALLWGYCCVDIDVPYDDEVYDAISDFPNKREIFAKAKEYAQKNVDFKLGEAYSQSDLMNAVQDAYGYNKKEAKKYIANADEKTKAELVKGYKDNAKRSFLTDSLNEGNGNVELLHSVAEPFVDALAELEDRGEEVEITWNFGFDRDGNVTAGVDLRPTPRITKAKKTDELFKIVLPQFEKLMKQYGFVLDDNIKHDNPSKNIFGGYHYQIKKIDLDECNIAEAFDLDEARYSDAYDEETRQNGWWYFTTHGVGPGTLPKDVHIIETREGQNEKGTWGDFIKLDGILNTDELKYFDLKELAPSDEEEEEDDFSGFFSDYEFNENLGEEATSNKKFTIKYGKGRPGGDSEVVEFPSAKEAEKYAANHAKGWGFEVVPFDESLNEDVREVWQVCDLYSGQPIDDYETEEMAKNEAAYLQQMKDEGMFIPWDGPFVVNKTYKRFDESLSEDKTPYGDTTIEDYVSANFSGSDADKQKLIAEMKKKANGKDYFNGLDMSVKDWEKAGKKFGLSMKKNPVIESLGLSKENKDRLIKIIDEAKKHSERDNSFDKSLDANLYLMFGTSGMSMHKVVNGKDKAKYVSGWREKSVEDIINELSNQDWEINENLNEDWEKEGQKFGLSMKRFPVTEGYKVDYISADLAEKTNKSSIKNAYDRNELSIVSRDGVYWFEGCPERIRNTVFSEMKKFYPELEYLYDKAPVKKEIKESAINKNQEDVDIDIWYPGEQIAYVNCSFYPNEGIYRGNLYNKSGRTIGDFSGKDSVAIEKQFPGIFGESLEEDTVKTSDGKWTNKGKEGTHGKFKTKKEADAQRKAMFANNFHESVNEDYDPSIYEPRQRTALDGKTWWYPYNTKEQKYSTLTKHSKYKTKKECQYAIEHCFDY